MLVNFFFLGEVLGEPVTFPDKKIDFLKKFSTKLRAHHLNQRFVESTKNPTIVKTQFKDSVRCGKNFLHKNCLYNLSFEVRWNLIQIPTKKKIVEFEF